MTKRAYVISGIIAALLVVVVVLIVVLVNVTRDADYRACLAAGGIYGTPSVVEISGIAQRCHQSVYG